MSKPNGRATAGVMVAILIGLVVAFLLWGTKGTGQYGLTDPGGLGDVDQVEFTKLTDIGQALLLAGAVWIGLAVWLFRDPK